MSCEAIFCFDTATVRFAIYPDGFDGPRILAQITESALRDHFGARGGGETLVEAYDRHSPEIDEKALKCYCREPGAPIVLHTADFDAEARLAEIDGMTDIALIEGGQVPVRRTEAQLTSRA